MRQMTCHLPGWLPHNGYVFSIERVPRLQFPAFDFLASRLCCAYCFLLSTIHTLVLLSLSYPVEQSVLEAMAQRLPTQGAMVQRLPTQGAMAQQLPLQVCSRARDEGLASVAPHNAPCSYEAYFSSSTACLSHRFMGCSDQLPQVIEYLAKRGYNRTEAMLRAESAFADQDGHVVPQRAEHTGGRKYRLAMGEYILCA